MLSEAGKHYGKNIIDKYSKKLQIEVGKKYNRSTLFRMKQFYNTFSNEKIAPMAQQLTWTHFLIIMPLKNPQNNYDKRISINIKKITLLSFFN